MKLINKILRFLFIIKYNSDCHRKIRSFVINFYDNYSTEYSFNSYRITKCRFYNFPNSILIEIYTLSPGMIIGKKGQCLDDFKASMQKRLPKPIEIKLEETNPFK